MYLIDFNFEYDMNLSIMLLFDMILQTFLMVSNDIARLKKYTQHILEYSYIMNY